jgi:hypothetical protein
MRKMSGWVLGVGMALLGCSGAEFDDGEEARLGSETQSIWGTDWSDSFGHATTAVRGIARPPGIVRQGQGVIFESYVWFRDKKMCTSRGADICSTPPTPYSCGNQRCEDIRAIGIAQNTKHVFTYFLDRTVMEGTPENLSLYKETEPRTLKMPINLQTKKPFEMTDMLDMDFSPNGSAYFYWRDGPSGLVFRTTGNSENAGNNAQVVTTLPLPVDITAISFLYVPGQLDQIETWYNDHSYNRSNNSLILTQR